MSLDLLSDDLVLDIIDLVSYNTRCLCDIARSSKRLNDLATPFLYKEIDLGTWNGEILLLRALLGNPRLGYVNLSALNILDTFTLYAVLCSKAQSSNVLPLSCPADHVTSKHCKSFTSCRNTWKTATDRSLTPSEQALVPTRISKYCTTPEEVQKWLLDLEDK
ncbi:uncharacterized protein LY89DRAFT_412770 [Mollisia scopiformis]|uniref:Uncharacterized protein n=1 Tax=Mollisia scopiformis TaxID=149040 RepID=A0A132B237_MOLSC|nr:uncharacterized protein LY89DRAFT_412770 [Mollisia scopiformis]KUJ06303.1 hypothetical protein LY89DRAFT_412770 [Mollisia scopiformis]